MSEVGAMDYYRVSVTVAVPSGYGGGGESGVYIVEAVEQELLVHGVFVAVFNGTASQIAEGGELWE
jgi:hypothetical protein